MMSGLVDPIAQIEDALVAHWSMTGDLVPVAHR
jgi:hypothetical protein